MPKPESPFAIRLARLAGRLVLALAAITALALTFLAMIAFTDGAGSGLVAWSATLGTGVALAAGGAGTARGRRGSCRSCRWPSRRR